jgi:hypothetical protein
MFSMNDQPQLDESAQEIQSAIAALACALSTCHRELMAVSDPQGRRRTRLSPTCWEELRRTVADYTLRAKSAGAYPERVIVRIKQIATENAPHLDRDSPLRAAIIQLSLASYFDLKDRPR